MQPLSIESSVINMNEEEIKSFDFTSKISGGQPPYSITSISANGEASVSINQLSANITYIRQVDLIPNVTYTINANILISDSLGNSAYNAVTINVMGTKPAVQLSMLANLAPSNDNDMIYRIFLNNSPTIPRLIAASDVNLSLVDGAYKIVFKARIDSRSPFRHLNFVKMEYREDRFSNWNQYSTCETGFNNDLNYGQNTYEYACSFEHYNEFAPNRQYRIKYYEGAAAGDLIPGCKEPTAANYNASANFNDTALCQYGVPEYRLTFFDLSQLIIRTNDGQVPNFSNGQLNNISSINFYCASGPVLTQGMIIGIYNSGPSLSMSGDNVILQPGTDIFIEYVGDKYVDFWEGGIYYDCGQGYVEEFRSAPYTVMQKFIVPE